MALAEQRIYKFRTLANQNLTEVYVAAGEAAQHIPCLRCMKLVSGMVNADWVDARDIPQLVFSINQRPRRWPGFVRPYSISPKKFKWVGRLPGKAMGPRQLQSRYAVEISMKRALRWGRSAYNL